MSRGLLRTLKAAFWTAFALDGLLSALLTYRWIRTLLRLPGPEVYRLTVALFLIPSEKVLRVGGALQFAFGLANLLRTLGLIRGLPALPRRPGRQPAGRSPASAG